MMLIFVHNSMLIEHQTSYFKGIKRYSTSTAANTFFEPVVVAGAWTQQSLFT